MRPNVSVYNISMIFALICGFSLLLSSCGSGGGGGGGGAKDATLTTNNAPQAVSAAMGGLSLLGTTSLGGIGGLQKAKPDSTPPLRSIVNKVISLSKNHQERVDSGSLMKSLQKGSDTFKEDCTDGGTVSGTETWDGPAEPADDSEKINDRGSITYNSCKEGSLTMSGTLTVAFEGPLSDPSKFTISVRSLSYADSVTNDNFSMTNFNIVGTDLTFDNNDELTAGTLTLDGSASGTVSGEPVDSELDNFKIAFSSNASGDTFSVSGRIRAGCLDGWVTVATTTPIFTPYWSDCPTQGEVMITAGTGKVRVTVESDSKITVDFNDELVQTYHDCNEVEGLCAG